jgi:hypothetical protein
LPGYSGVTQTPLCPTIDQVAVLELHAADILVRMPTNEMTTPT